MTFTELVTAFWRNRVRIVGGTAIVLAILFLALYSLNDRFQVSVDLALARIFTLLFEIALALFGLSLIVKGAVGNTRSKGGKK